MISAKMLEAGLESLREQMKQDASHYEDPDDMIDDTKANMIADIVSAGATLEVASVVMKFIYEAFDLGLSVGTR